ncbi:hypothetical protein theurythT_19370 [Thalassotalea eurytherma]|uniref:Secreted protein n=1 Tax=Thalassotalea eurytherma TaxID=1144278 RepID=A0ABQ6H2U2_9GAMM|nr:hypothetical protein theurythT_19370 [Thalassotalea eurytherma]
MACYRKATRKLHWFWFCIIKCIPNVYGPIQAIGKRNKKNRSKFSLMDARKSFNRRIFNNQQRTYPGTFSKPHYKPFPALKFDFFYQL